MVVVVVVVVVVIGLLGLVYLGGILVVAMVVTAF